MSSKYGQTIGKYQIVDVRFRFLIFFKAKITLLKTKIRKDQIVEIRFVWFAVKKKIWLVWFLYMTPNMEKNQIDI